MGRTILPGLKPLATNVRPAGEDVRRCAAASAGEMSPGCVASLLRASRRLAALAVRRGTGAKSAVLSCWAAAGGSGFGWPVCCFSLVGGLGYQMVDGALAGLFLTVFGRDEHVHFSSQL